MKNLLKILATSNKALVPVLVGAVLALLAQLGLTPDMSLKDAVTALITGALVWLVPNVQRRA